MLRQPLEERSALERLESGELAGECVVEMRPHVGEIVVEEDRRGPGVVGGMGAQEPPERREGKAPARRLRHQAQRGERAQQPVDAVGNETARRGNCRMVGNALLHHVGETEPCEGSNRARHPQAAQELQHFLVQQRGIGVGGLIALVVHEFPSTTRGAADARIDQFGERS
jgi:hypothetical protein